MRKRRSFTNEFKKQVIEEVQNGLINFSEALRKYELKSSVYYKWRDQYQLGQLDNVPNREGEYRNRISELERKVGQQAMEIDLLKKLKEMQADRIKEKQSKVLVMGALSGGVK